MTIKEALELSAVVKRKDWDRFFHIEELINTMRLCRQDLMADDWEAGATPARA